MTKIHLLWKIKSLLLYVNATFKCIKCSFHRKKKIFILNTPDHFNMGDYAIKLAEYEFFKEYFPQIYVTDFSRQQCKIKHMKLEKVISKDDLVFIHGGGYLGDLWPEEEAAVFALLDKFPENKIFIFPQTIYYKDNIHLMELRKKYAKYKNLTVYTREKQSLDFFEKLNEGNTEEKIKVDIFPDMVTFLKPEMEKVEVKKNIIFCFRNDIEKITASDIVKKLERMLVFQNFRIIHLDTVYVKNPKNKIKNIFLTKSKIFKEILQQFASAELILTDRLHGMIFAAIVGTPCIALNNKSKKIEGVYQWISYLPYIKFMDAEKVTEEIIRELLREAGKDYDREPIKEEFDRMAMLIQKEI